MMRRRGKSQQKKFLSRAIWIYYVTSNRHIESLPKKEDGCRSCVIICAPLRRTYCHRVDVFIGPHRMKERSSLRGWHVDDRARGGERLLPICILINIDASLVSPSYVSHKLSLSFLWREEEEESLSVRYFTDCVSTIGPFGAGARSIDVL